MAMTKKISRKELRQPDEFITFWGRALEFAERHTREILIGLLAAAVIGLLIWGGSAYSKRQQERASHLVTQAQYLLNPSLGMQAGEGEGEPGGANPEATDQGIEILEGVVESYGRTKASRVARILLGRLYHEKGDYDRAIVTYETFLKGENRKAELTAMAWEGLAYSYEAKEAFGEALGCYEKLSRMELSNVRGWGQVGLARCYERLGELEKALDAYRDLLAEQPQHPKAAEAKASIARITQSRAPAPDPGEPPD